MQDNTENLPYFYLEFQDPRTGSLITKTLPMTHEGMEQMKELDKLTEQHNEEFNTLFNSLCPQFDERLSAIGGWIAHKYDNILPTKKEFIEWFIRTKIGTYKIIPHYSINDNEEYLQEHLEYIDFWFPDYENTFIPNLIDDYLLEYCQEYVNGLELKKEKIFQQLSTPDHVEVGETVQQPPIIKDEVNGIPCTEFDNLFGADIKRKNEVWQYMKLLAMIDNEGKCLHPEKTATIRAFVVVMRNNFRLPFAKSPDELIKIFGLKLSISDILRVRPATEIELKEQEIVNLINAFETKTLPFT